MQKTKRTVTWKAWGETHPGRERDNNEDRILCEAGRGIFVVADGMGGEAAGEVAAEQAVDSIKKRLHQETGTVARRIREAIAGANNEIYRLAERNPRWRGMACVVTAAVIDDGTLHIGHVGDSRLYKVLEGRIRKITADHSPVGLREDAGELTEAEAKIHPRRNEVFRDVGSQPHQPDDGEFIDYAQIPFESAAAIILCSDGLSDMLTSDEMLRTVIECAGKPRDSVRQLIEKANAAGGKDNIAVIVVEADGFAASCAKMVSRGDAHGESAGGGRPARWKDAASTLRGRWTFLLLGLLLGLLAAYLWNRLQEPAAEEPEITEAPSPPRVLKVEAAGAEYATLAGALAAARSGDRIEVGDGEYEESIRLKDGVDIAAHSPGRAVLRLTRALPDTEAAITAEGIQRAGVSGFVIKAESSAGLLFGIRISGSNVDLSNLEVSGAIRAGILVEGDSNGTIAASFIHSNAGPGIVMQDTASPVLVGNVLHANGAVRNRPGPGLYLMGASNPEVKRNVFSANGAEAIRLQRQELKEKMMDNLFIGYNKKARAVVVEKPRQ